MLEGLPLDGENIQKDNYIMKKNSAYKTLEQ